MKKMNNKGFSLVELIVVVLIMAIIAVALAPQVMKWVDKSRLSADRETYDSLISNVQVALTDKSIGDTCDAATFSISKTGTTCTGGADIQSALAIVNDSWSKGKAKRDTTYTFTVTTDKQIHRGSGEADPANVAYAEADS